MHECSNDRKIFLRIIISSIDRNIEEKSKFQAPNYDE